MPSGPAAAVRRPYERPDSLHNAHDVQLVAYASAADGRERAGVVGLDALDQPEERLPGPVGVADRVPQLAPDDAHDLQLIADARAADGRERAGVVGLDALDQPE